DGATASAATASSGAQRDSWRRALLCEREARLGRQPEEDLAYAMGGPGARAPLLGGHVVAAVEHLGEAHLAEPCDGEEGRGLHLDGEAPLGAAARDLAGRLAVDGIGRPGLACDEVPPMRAQRRLDGGDGLRMGLYLAARRQVVVRGALVAHRGGGDDDLPDGDAAIEHAAPPQAMKS